MTRPTHGPWLVLKRSLPFPVVPPSALRSCVTPTVFELADGRYIEGAPFEWRRVLTPGLPVRLDFVEQGLAIVTATRNQPSPGTA
jgi:hypothetical protein